MIVDWTRRFALMLGVPVDVASLQLEARRLCTMQEKGLLNFAHFAKPTPSAVEETWKVLKECRAVRRTLPSPPGCGRRLSPTELAQTFGQNKRAHEKKVRKVRTRKEYLAQQATTKAFLCKQNTPTVKTSMASAFKDVKIKGRDHKTGRFLSMQ
jgi:hypothetical protein